MENEKKQQKSLAKSEKKKQVKELNDKAIEEGLKPDHGIDEEKTISLDRADEFVSKYTPPIVTPSKSNKKRNFILYTIFIVFCVGSLIFTAISDFSNQSAEGNASFVEIMSKIGEHWYYLVFGLLALGLVYFSEAYKTGVMVKTFTGKFRMKLAWHTSVVCKYYDNVTPLASGGQPFAIYNLSKHGVPSGVASATPIISLAFSQFIFVFLAIVAFFCDAFHVFGETRLLTGSILALGIVGLIVSAITPIAIVMFASYKRFAIGVVKAFIMFFYKIKLIKDPQATLYRVIRGVVNYIKCLHLIKEHKWLIIRELFGSLIFHLANCSMVFFTLKTFGYDVPNMHMFIEWLQVCQWCMILYCVVSFIPTPGNSGASELTFYTLFSSFLVTYSGQSGYCFAAILTWRFLCFYMVLIIGFIVTTTIRYRTKKHERALLASQLAEGVGFDEPAKLAEQPTASAEITETADEKKE